MSKLFRAVTALLFVTMMLAASVASADPNTQPYGPQPPIDFTIPATSVGSQATIFTVPAGGYSALNLQFTSVGSGNSVNVTASNDNSTFLQTTCGQLGTPNAALTTAAFTPTTTAIYTCQTALKYVRVAVTTYGSGTVTVRGLLRTSPDAPFVKVGGSNSSSIEVVGNVASGATDSGNPVKVGGIYNSTKPTLTNGQRGDLQVGTRGSLLVTLAHADGTAANSLEAGFDGNNNATNALVTFGRGNSYNGTTWDRDFTCPSSAVINVAAAATTELVALTASQVIRVCSFVITGDTAATTATFVYGTGSNCAGSPVALTGAMRMVDEGSISSTGMNGSLFRTASANALCLTAATGAVTGFVTYAKY